MLGTGRGLPGEQGGSYPTGNGVTLDEREGEARWKMLGAQAWGEGYIATSEDGLTWGNKTTMPSGRWDSHLNVQLESDSGKWVAYARALPTTKFGGYAGNAQTVRIQSVSESKTSKFLGEWGTIVPTGMNASEWYQPDALVSFEYEGIYLAFSNIISFNTTTREQHQQGSGDNPGGTVTSELVFSTDAKHWRYLLREYWYLMNTLIYHVIMGLNYVLMFPGVGTSSPASRLCHEVFAVRTSTAAESSLQNRATSRASSRTPTSYVSTTVVATVLSSARVAARWGWRAYKSTAGRA